MYNWENIYIYIYKIYVHFIHFTWYVCARVRVHAFNDILNKSINKFKSISNKGQKRSALDDSTNDIYNNYIKKYTSLKVFLTSTFFMLTKSCNKSMWYFRWNDRICKGPAEEKILS